MFDVQNKEEVSCLFVYAALQTQQLWQEPKHLSSTFLHDVNKQGELENKGVYTNLEVQLAGVVCG